jgi:hypothetical protein
MTESKIESFNIEPLVFEIQNVIKNGLKVLLKDYIDRHDLLEKTHKQIMKLPSVMNEINKGGNSDSDSESDLEPGDDKSIFISISDMTRDLVKKEMSYVESKLDRIEKKYESISPLISKILDKLESINAEVKVLKEKPRDNIKIVQMNHEKSYISNIIKPSIVSACENENIKFEIDENDEDDEDDEEEDDDKEEIVEPIKVKKEVIIIEDEELEELEEEEIEEEEEEDDVIEEDVIEAVVVADTKKEVETVVVEEESDADEEDEVETEASEDEEEDEEEEVVPTPIKVDVEEEEAELEIITIDDIDYCTNDLENGFIWELNEDGEQCDKIGYLKEGEPFFYADEN